MTYAKALEDYEKATAAPEDEADKLCTVPGCRNHWTADFGQRLCRQHFKTEQMGQASKPPGWFKDKHIRRVA